MGDRIFRANTFRRHALASPFIWGICRHGSRALSTRACDIKEGPNMIGKLIKYILILLILFYLLSHFGYLGAEAQQGDFHESHYDKGHTGLHGRTTQADSNFVFELSGPYWYENLDLYLETWENESEYSIMINSEIVDEGTILEGKTHMNFTLPTDRRCNLIVEIDQYRYEYRNKLITERSSENWGSGPEGEKEGTIYSHAEITILTAKVLGVSLAAFTVATPLAGYFVKKQSEEQVYEVI